MENLPDEKYRYCFEIIGSIKMPVAAAEVRAKWWGLNKFRESRTNLKILPTGNEIELTARLRRNELPMSEESILWKSINFI